METNRKETSKGKQLEPRKQRPKLSELVPKGDHVATGTGDSNKSENRQPEATATEQGRPDGERIKAGAKNTTTSTKRNSHEGRKGSPRDKEEPEAGCDHYTKKKPAEMQGSRTQTTEGLPRRTRSTERTGGVSK